MKHLLLIAALILTTLSAIGQPVDFTTYDVIAKRGDVSVIVKGDDYRMVVGSLKKPKINLMLGNTKEQAASWIERIATFSAKSSNYAERDRMVALCGVPFFFSVSGAGEDEKYSFKAENSRVQFSLTAKDCRLLKEALQSGTAVQTD